MWKGIKQFFRKQGAQVGFWIAKRFGVNLIPYKPAQFFIKELLGPVEEAVLALTDSDPDDKAQLKQIACENSEKITLAAFELIRNISYDQIKDEETKAYILAALEDIEPKLVEQLQCK